MSNLKAFPFDAVLSDGLYDREYTSDDFASYFGKFIGNGVYAKKGNCLEVLADNNSSMYVTVRDGSAFINGRARDWDSDQQIRLSNAHASYDRYDLIVVRLDKVARDITIEIVEGVASASPVVPDITQTDDVYELCLAQVLVKTGVTSVSQSSVTDKRSSTLCGWVSGLIDQIEAEEFFEQYRLAFDQWFEEIKEVLDESAEGNLMNKIEETNTRIDNLTAEDVGASAEEHNHSDLYYTKNEIDSMIGELDSALNTLIYSAGD